MGINNNEPLINFILNMGAKILPEYYAVEIRPPAMNASFREEICLLTRNDDISLRLSVIY